MRALAVLVIACALHFASASMMGIDFGSEFIKVAAPKNNNIDIVLNEQSHRKTHNFIGFRGEERYFSEDAKNLAPRFPDNMFTYTNQLVGRAFNDTEFRSWFDTLHIKSTLEEARKPVVGNDTEAPLVGTIALRTGGRPDIAYTAETLMGMQFGHIRSIVKKDTGSRLRDAAVTIPVSFDLRQRQAIIDAAALAGVNVVGTVHVTTAIALQYGLKARGFGNATFTLAVLDVGATHADMGVYEFTPARTVRKGEKKLKKAEALGTMTVKAIRSDNGVGGRMFDTCLAELIEERFVKANPKLSGVLAADTLAKRKAVIALLRAGNKAKEILSANKQAGVVAEGMAPGKDFPTSITRDEFESRCGHLFSRVEKLVTSTAEAADVKLSNVDAFELTGGSSRVPKLIDTVSAVRGKVVDRTLNGDESAAFGAAFFAGVATQRFRLESFAVVEPVLTAQPEGTTTIAFALSPKKEDEETKYRPLFTDASRIGHVKTITVNRTANFNITIAQNRSGDLTEDFKVRVTGVDSGLRSVNYYADDEFGLGMSTDLNHANNTHSIRVELRASESGLIVVESAELRISYVKNVTRSIKVNMTEEELEVELNRTVALATERHERSEVKRREKLANATAAAENSTDANATTAETVEGGEEASTEASGNETNNAVDDEAAAEARLAARIEKAVKAMPRTKKDTTKVEELKKTTLELKTRNVFVFPSPITRGDKKQFRAILEDFDFADEQRRQLAKAKNDLEGYLIWARSDGVLENQELKDAGRLTEEAVASIEAALKNVSDWLDEEAGDSTPREEYVEHLGRLKAAVKPVIKKRKATKATSEEETAAAPDAAAAAEETDAETSEASTESSEEAPAEETDSAKDGDSSAEL